MKRIKIDYYCVYEKGREYKVLKFHFVKHMWAFECHEDGIMIDGCMGAFKLLSYAFAILANEPDKLIYFPCRQEGIGQYYADNKDAVLCRPELQLRRSLWTKIRKKLDRQHYRGKYCFQYDKKKLNDYFEKVLMKTENSYWVALKKQEKYFVKEILGDTAFFVYPRVECYAAHYHTVSAMVHPDLGKDKEKWSWIGYIYTETAIGWHYERAKKEEEKKKAEEDIWQN